MTDILNKKDLINYIKNVCNALFNKDITDLLNIDNEVLDKFITKELLKIYVSPEIIDNNFTGKYGIYGKNPESNQLGVCFFKVHNGELVNKKPLALQLQCAFLGIPAENDESVSYDENFKKFRSNIQEWENDMYQSGDPDYNPGITPQEIFRINDVLKQQLEEASKPHCDQSTINEVKNKLQYTVQQWSTKLLDISQDYKKDQEIKSVVDCQIHWLSYNKFVIEVDNEIKRNPIIKQAEEFLNKNERFVAANKLKESGLAIQSAIKESNELIKIYSSIDIKSLESCGTIEELAEKSSKNNSLNMQYKFHVGYDIIKIINNMYPVVKLQKMKYTEFEKEVKALGAIQQVFKGKKNTVSNEIEKLYNRLGYILKIKSTYEQIIDITDRTIQLDSIKEKYNDLFTKTRNIFDVSPEGEDQFQEHYNEYQKEVDDINERIDNKIKEIIEQKDAKIDNYIKIIQKYSVNEFLKLQTLDRLRIEVLSRMKEEVRDFNVYVNSHQENYTQLYNVRCYDETRSKFMQYTFSKRKIDYYRSILSQLSTLSEHKDYHEIDSLLKDLEKNLKKYDYYVDPFKKSNPIQTKDISLNVVRYNNIKTIMPEGLYDINYYQDYLFAQNSKLVQSKYISIDPKTLKANEYLKEYLEIYQQIIHSYPASILSLADESIRNIQDAIKLLADKKVREKAKEKGIIDFAQKVEILVDRLKSVPAISDKISLKISELGYCSFDYDTFKKILDDIEQLLLKLVVLNLTIEKYIEEINEKILSKLSNRLNNALEVWNTEFKYLCENNKLAEFEDDGEHIKYSPEFLAVRNILSQTYTYSVVRNKKQFVLDPSLSEIREQWYNNFSRFLSIITGLKSHFCVEPIRGELNKAIINNINGEYIEQSYELINKYIDDIHKYVKQWLQFHVIWDVTVISITNRVGKDIVKWEKIIDEINQIKSDLSGKSDTVNRVGPSIIQSQGAIDAVSRRYDSLLDGINEEYSNILGEEIDTFNEILINSKEFLEQSNFTETSNDIQLVLELTKIKNNKSIWEEKISIINNSDNNVKKRLHNKIQLSQLNGTWNSVYQLYEKRSKVYEQSYQKIKANVKEEDIKIQKTINESIIQWKNDNPQADVTPDTALKILDKYQKLFIELDNKYEKEVEAKIALDLPVKDENTIKPLLKEVENLTQTWSRINEIWKEIEVIRQEYWSKIEINDVKIKLDKIYEKLSAFPIHSQCHPSFTSLVKSIEKYNKLQPLLKDLQLAQLKERHWSSIFEILHFSIPYHELTIGMLWDSNIGTCLNQIRDVLSIAQGEMALEVTLSSITQTWHSYEIETTLFQQKYQLIRGWEDLFLLLDDHVGTLSAMKQSPYYDTVKQQAENIEKQLIDSRLLFETWMEVQRKFVYFYGVFSPESGVQKQLAKAASTFSSVDSNFMKLMNNYSKNLRILNIPNIQEIREKLEFISDKLTALHRSLSEYLESQRTAFSRFYFIGDDDLLEIIGHSTDPIKLQRHLGKLFAGISSLEIVDNDKITHLHSREGENVDLQKEIKISDFNGVNEWLSELEKNMQRSLAALLDQALKEIKSLDDSQQCVPFIQKFPSQILLLSTGVNWSNEMEKAFLSHNKSSLDLPYGHCVKLLEILAEGVLSDLEYKDRKKYEQLITEYVYNRDVTKQLIDDNVTDSNNVEWGSKLKYYYDPQENELLKKLNIRVANASFYYGFEYLGVAEKLVQTPLTDRCYLTLTEALHLRLGGNPFGPAGTGKTETVKALGSQLGRFVLVFNCGENFDFLAMGRIFRGLCQVGAWGCFDEFNRLEERILSAVSQQIQTIQSGLLENQRQIQILDNNVTLNSNVGIFVTMNPGYAGRSNLPDNLKQLFRSFAMIKPDWDLISEVMLFSQGFQTSKKLAKKVVLLFSLCEDQLSSQPHYDFGLRALKSVLVSAGSVKRKKMCEMQNNDIDDKEKFEQRVLLESITQTLVPKLVAEDVPLLESLVSSVFPGESLYEIENEELLKEIEILANKYNLSLENEWVNKILQLYQVLELRHGVMLVGPSGTGKSYAWKILLEALEKTQDIKGEYYIIDPKGMEKDDLYGKLDNTTMEWCDGIFTHILRQIVESRRGEDKKRHWIVFDGDVDPEWAENLNSVLDDNKVLTLPNGERLPLNDNVRILFEVENLKYATLATVSRCGMIWFSGSVLSTQAYLKNFIEKLKTESLPNIKMSRELQQNIRNTCVQSIEKYFEPDDLIEKALKWCILQEHIMEVTELRLLNSTMSLLRRGIINIFEYNEEHPVNQLTEDNISNYYQKYLLFSIIWGFCGSLSMSKRVDFCTYLQSISSIKLPADGNLIEYEVRVTDSEWHKWKESVPRVDIEPEQVIEADVVIPTVDTLRHKEIIKIWMESHDPVILCGPPGSGKSMTITSCLTSLNDIELAALNFSSATTPDLILKTFNQYCNYVKTPNGAILRPKAENKWLCIFCDEINLPEQDAYGTQCVISFIRQLVEQNGFWKQKESIWVTLERIQFIGACNPPTDPGRVPLTKRFLTHTPIIFVDFPDKESLTQIYGTFNRALLSLQLPLKPLADSLTDAMIQFYLDNQKHFTPDMRVHYVYSPRELSRWTRALYEVLSIRSDMNIEDLVRLFCHEALRLFYDRLVLEEEKEWCNKHVDEIALQYFPKSLDVSCLSRPIYYTNWLSKIYESVDKDELKQHIETRLKTFYEEVLDVPLVVFDDMIDHVLRIDRVLRQPLGHLLLVGESGVGKTVLSRFVAWMNGLSVFQIKVSHKYTIDSFDEDLRDVLKRSGIDNEKICFIFDESNILSSAFLERMNALLANGDVPGLFDDDQTKAIIQSIKKDSEYIMMPYLPPYQFFLSRVQHNLHIVFTMNPASGDYNNRTATSPALFNRCVIDWFGTWPREALAQVGSQLIKLDFSDENYKPSPMAESIIKTQSSLTKHDAIVNCMVLIHEDVRNLCSLQAKKHLVHNFICPRDYLDFIHHYINLFEEQRESIEEQQKYLNTGLNKLKETEDQVKNMQINLRKKNEELNKKKEQADQKLQEMLTKQKVAEASKIEAEKMSESLQEKEKETEIAKKVIEDELAEVEPKIKAAEENVKNIDKRSLNEVKSLSKPPINVEMTIKMVGVLLKIKDNTWKELKKVMTGTDFITQILEYDSKSITKEMVKTIKKQFLNHENFDYEAVLHSSKACAPLFQWVVSQIEYGDILERVEPQRKKVREYEEELNKLHKDYDKVNQELNELNETIEVYKREYGELIEETTQLKKNIENVTQNVDRSINLVESLKSERNRWDNSTSTFATQLETLDGDCLIGSAFLAYIGFFNHRNRKILQNEMLNILETYNITVKENLSLIEYLSTPSQRLDWTTNCSLLNDNLYLENAIILNRYIRYPLIIDPSGQSLNYLLKLYEKSKINKSSFLNSTFMKDLESSVRFGYPLLVEDVENIDPILNPLLNKELRKTGGRTLVRIGDRDIDFSPSFRLFLTTRDSTFQFAPDISSRVSFVNFTVTPSSLESQTLNKLLLAERPEVEEERNKLLLLQGQYQLELRNLEEKLLSELNSLEGNILENTTMINTLEELKKQSKVISEDMEKTLESIKQLEEVSSLYLPLASVISHIYFALEQISSIHFLYQFSLSSYLHFIDQIVTTKFSPELSNMTEPKERINYLNIQVFKYIYTHISRSLLKKDEIVLAMRLAQIKLMDCNDKPSDLEYELLFTDKHTSTNISSTTNKIIELLGSKLDDNQIQLLNNLLTLPNFDYVKLSMENNHDYWVDFMNCEKPEENMTEKWDEYSLSNQHKYFRWLIVLKALRPDRLLIAYDEYIRIVFGDSFIQTNDNIFSNIPLETYAEEPLLLCSERGYDPSKKVEDYAKEAGKKLISVALGSGEGFTLASKSIPQAVKDGSYVLLRNVHLCPSWLNDLIKLLYSLKYNPEFRLFLTSEIHPNLPSSLIQMSYVIVFEPPDGIRSSLLRSISSIPDKVVNEKPNIRSKLYFLISWIHAVIVERLRYSPVGWTKQYEFNDADFNCALKIIDEYIGYALKKNADVKADEIRWDSLRDLLCTSVYGGKVDNACDERLLNSIFTSLFVEKQCRLNAPLAQDGDNILLKSPTFTVKSDYIAWISELPLKNSPLWLGLPVTAEARLLQTRGYEVLHNIALTQDITIESEENSNDLSKPQWMQILINSIKEWLKLLVPKIIIPQRTEENLSHPLFRFLEREVNIGSKLFNTIKNDLQSVISSINGDIKNTNYIRNLIKSLRKDIVPDEWKNSYRMINTTVSLWLQDFNNRIIQLNKLSELQISELLHTPIWLGGLFYPEAYITATRQTVAQVHGWSLEDLSLQVSYNTNKITNEEFLISNLSIEGGEYDKDNILIPSKSIRCTIDKMQLCWKNKDQIDLKGFIEIPLYLNNERKELLLFILIKSQYNQTNWNERGCAIISHQ